MGNIYHCQFYPSRGRICVNNHGLTFKDFTYIIEDKRTQNYVDGREIPLSGGWKAEIARGYKGYCNNCMQGRTEPRTESEREEFLDGYLGEHERWSRDKEKRKKLAIEQERIMERLRRDKGETEAWTEAD